MKLKLPHGVKYDIEKGIQRAKKPSEPTGSVDLKAALFGQQQKENIRAQASTGYSKSSIVKLKLPTGVTYDKGKGIVRSSVVTKEVNPSFQSCSQWNTTAVLLEEHAYTATIASSYRTEDSNGSKSEMQRLRTTEGHARLHPSGAREAFSSPANEAIASASKLTSPQVHIKRHQEPSMSPSFVAGTFRDQLQNDDNSVSNDSDDKIPSNESVDLGRFQRPIAKHLDQEEVNERVQTVPPSLTIQNQNISTGNNHHSVSFKKNTSGGESHINTVLERIMAEYKRKRAILDEELHQALSRLLRGQVGFDSDGTGEFHEEEKL